MDMIRERCAILLALHVESEYQLSVSNDPKYRQILHTYANHLERVEGKFDEGVWTAIGQEIKSAGIELHELHIKYPKLFISALDEVVKAVYQVSHPVSAIIGKICEDYDANKTVTDSYILWISEP